MYRIKVKDENLGLKVVSFEVDVDNKEDAKAWLKESLSCMGVNEPRLDEGFEYEKLDLLLDNNSKGN